MIGFLKSFGAAVLKITQIVSGIAPTVQQYVPSSAGVIQTVEDDLTAIAKVVQQTEVFGAALGLNGQDKLKAAIPAASQILLQSELLSGRKIKDEAKYATAIAQITSGVADVLSSLEDNISTHDKT